VSDRLVLRPAREEDLPDLLGIASEVTGGITTLPADARHLRASVGESVRALAHPVVRPGAERYLFVLEDRGAGRVAGSGAVAARVGGFDPFYTYEIREEALVHAPLGIQERVAVLHLKRAHKGPSELSTLALASGYRGRGLARLVSLGRLLFVRAHPERFERRIIAELRGWLDDEGRSPFWESVGRHFFRSDFARADFLSGLGEKDFIEDLMPRHPIYVPLLPEDVRAVIGRPHRDAEPARRVLEGEGLRFAGEIDIFDAGPLFAADVGDIRAVREARDAPVGVVVEGEVPGPPQVLANGRLDFRACLGGAAPGPDGTVAIGRRTAELLEVGPGDAITYVARSPEG
jgi:arginine N-succinyltransferase